MFSCKRAIPWLVSAIIIGCDAIAAQPELQAVPEAWYAGELPILRFQADPARERGWILTRMGVLVFDFKTRKTTGYVPLPEWVWAHEQFSNLPDLALGPNGEAVITSNVLPILWRVDPLTLAVSRHELVTDVDADKDVGLTGLTYSAEQGAFFAVSNLGSLWRIDPLFRRAQKIELSGQLPRPIGVAVRTTVNRFFGLCVRGEQGDWTVNLAPDRRYGYVIAQPCNDSGAVISRSREGRRPMRSTDK
jgi:hypothetical protein